MATEAQELWQWEKAPDDWSIGERMVKAREARGVNSAEAMAVLLSAYFEVRIPKSTVGAWERGAQPTRNGRKQADVIRAYSEILHYDEAYFWGGIRCFSANPLVSMSMPEGEMELPFPTGQMPVAV